MKADMINKKCYHISCLAIGYFFFHYYSIYFHSKYSLIYCKHTKHFPANNLIPVLKPLIEELKLFGYKQLGQK